MIFYPCLKSREDFANGQKHNPNKAYNGKNRRKIVAARGSNYVKLRLSNKPNSPARCLQIKREPERSITKAIILLGHCCVIYHRWPFSLSRDIWPLYALFPCALI